MTSERSQARIRRQAPPFAMVPRWLLRSGISDRAVRVYALLADYADYETGEAFPSRSTLAEEAGTSVNSIDRALAELLQIGALRKHARRSDKGVPMSNVYTVMLLDPRDEMEGGSRTDGDTPTGGDIPTGAPTIPPQVGTYTPTGGERTIPTERYPENESSYLAADAAIGETTGKTTPTDVKPPKQANGGALLAYMLDLKGNPYLPPQEMGRQGGIARGILRRGYSRQQVEACMRWLQERFRTWDMLTVSNQIAAFSAQEQQAAPEPPSRGPKRGAALEQHNADVLARMAARKRAAPRDVTNSDDGVIDVEGTVTG